MSTLLDNLNWRYATKAFNSDKKLSKEQLETLLNAVQLAPSSYGLQPFKVIVVSNQEVKEQLKAAAYSQAQVAQAPLPSSLQLHTQDAPQTEH